MAWRDLMQKLAGDDKAKGDEITPTGSPIDLVAGGLGSAMGGSMAAAAPALLDNEIGAVGANVAQRAIPTAGQYAADVSAGAPVSQGAVNQLIGTPQTVTAAQQAMNAAAEVNPYSLEAQKAQQAASRALDYASRFKTLKNRLGK